MLFFCVPDRMCSAEKGWLPVFAGVLGGVVLFKQDFTEQYRDALTFIPL